VAGRPVRGQWTAPALVEALNLRRAVAAPRKYPDELRERAMRFTLGRRRDPATRVGALQRVGEHLGINLETLRGGSRCQRRLKPEQVSTAES